MVDDEESDGAEGRSAGRPAALMPLVAVLLVGCLVALGWSWFHRGQSLDSDEALADSGATPQIPDAESLAPPVTVSGRILLEVFVEAKTPVVRVGSGMAAVVESGEDEQDADGGTGEEGLVDPGIDRDVQGAGGEANAAAKVTLEPPEAGSCTITAWRDGHRLSDPVTCDVEGRFEVPVPADSTGRTAFELSVPGRLRAVVEVEVPAQGTARLPPVALGLAQTVRGHVVDGRGQPLAGVEIQAMPIPNLAEAEPWRASSGDDGSFSFDTLPPGPVAMRAAPEGYDPTVIEAIAPQDDVLLTMAGLIDLEGRVVGPSQALSSARVRLEGSGIWPAREVGVGKDGTFTFEAIPDGIYAIEAYVARDDGPEYASIPLENVTPDLVATLALIPAQRVEVDVVSPGGDPVAEARVSVGNSQVGLLAKVATADAQGRARVGPLVPGDYVARADADAFLPSDPVQVRIEDVPVEPVELRLRRAGRIEGTVLDESGHAIADATVIVDSDALFTIGESQARANVFEGALVAAGTLGVTKGPVPEIPKFTDDYARAPQDVRQVQTDDDGRFVLSGLMPGQYSLQAVDGRYAASTTQTVEIRPGTVRGGLELVLRTGWRLSGRVRDGNGRPVPGATVELDDGTAYRTDRRGVFVAGRRRGRVELVARASGLAPRSKVVRVEGRVDVEFRLENADAMFEGRVDNDNGQPIEDARVTAHAVDGLSASRLAWSDERGLWSIDDVAAGTYEIEFVAPGLLPKTRRTSVGEGARERVDVELATGWSIEVEVREFGRRDPLSKATVTAADQRVLTGADGLATLDQLSEAAVDVRVEAPGFATVTQRVQRPAPGSGDRTSVRFELVEGGSIEGSVTDYRGDPVPRSRVVVRSAGDDSVLAERRTDARGMWSVVGIPEGDVVVEAFPPPDRAEELAEVAQDSDVLRGRVTADVALRFDRQ